MLALFIAKLSRTCYGELTPRALRAKKFSFQMAAETG